MYADKKNGEVQGLVVGAPVRVERRLGGCAQCARVVLVVVNFFFLLAGIAGVIASALITSGHFSRFFTFCSFCNKLSVGGIVTFSVVLVISGVGFFSAWRRSNCLLAVYRIFLALLCLIGIGLGVVVILIHFGKFDSELHTAWNDAVANDPAGICTLETEASCSGWKWWCPGNATMSANPAECQLNCAAISLSQSTIIDMTTMTCNQRLHEEVQAYFAILVGASFGLALLALVGMGATCAIRRKDDEVYMEIAERF